jgi:hypothetical protein
MQNGPKTMTSTHRPKSARPPIRSKQWPSNAVRPDFRGSQNAQRSYERYLALAQAQAQFSDVIGGIRVGRSPARPRWSSEDCNESSLSTVSM